MHVAVKRVCSLRQTIALSAVPSCKRAFYLDLLTVWTPNRGVGRIRRPLCEYPPVLTTCCVQLCLNYEWLEEGLEYISLRSLGDVGLSMWPSSLLGKAFQDLWPVGRGVLTPSTYAL